LVPGPTTDPEKCPNPNCPWCYPQGEFSIAQLDDDWKEADDCECVDCAEGDAIDIDAFEADFG
jgi:hypothetical protein